MKEILNHTDFYHIKTIPVLLSLQGPITGVVISKIYRVESWDVMDQQVNESQISIEWFETQSLLQKLCVIICCKKEIKNRDI